MSADLEKLAEFYRNLQQPDIGQVLEGVAQIARKRDLPESYLNLSEKEPVGTRLRVQMGKMSQHDSEPLDESSYIATQKWIINAFTEILPATDEMGAKPIDMLAVMKIFNQNVGRNIPDSMPLRYLLMPSERNNNYLNREKFRKDSLRPLILGIDQRVRAAYNRGMLALYFNNIQSLRDLRELEGEYYFLKKMDDVGIVSLTLLQTAFYTEATYNFEFTRRHIDRNDYIWRPTPSSVRRRSK